METLENKITYKQILMVFCESLGWAGVNVMGYVFSNYYSLIQGAFGYETIQIANLNTIMAGASAICYFFGGFFADIFKPKINMTIGYLGLTACGATMLALPGYNIMKLVAVLVSFFGLGFYIPCALKYIAAMGNRNQQSKLYGYFYMFAAIESMLTTPFISAIISKSGDYDGMKAMLFFFCGMMIISLLIHYLWVERAVILAEKSKKAEAEKFSFKIVGDLLKNPNFYLVMLMACATTLPNHLNTYVQPLLQSEFGASSAVTQFVSQWANNGSAIILTPLAGIVAAKLGSTMRVISFSILLGVVASGAMLILPFDPAYMILLVVLVFCLRGVFNIGKPARPSMVGESRLPSASRGTINGLMFALTGVQKTGVSAFAAYALTSYEGATGYRMLYGISFVIMIICFILALYFSKRLKRAKERDAVEGTPAGIMV
ncbi:MFS transporter [Roseburia hominis]